MTTPSLYLYDHDGDLAIYRDVETVTAYLAADDPDGATNIINPFPGPASPDADSVVISADDAEGRYDCDGPAEALALRDAITSALTRAALGGRPCCVVDMRDLDGAKAEASRRARVAEARASIGRK